jgi:hypothetical protein
MRLDFHRHFGVQRLDIDQESALAGHRRPQQDLAIGGSILVCEGLSRSVNMVSSDASDLTHISLQFHVSRFLNQMSFSMMRDTVAV